ncbi:MAG: YajG family lipoprotein [Betaproteobacteria bacterium]|nr:YajG family lipoprotein [Betaproteobacteria bacterium]
MAALKMVSAPFNTQGNRKMKAKSLAFACCVAVASLPGCALTTEQVELNYTQQTGVSRIAGADAVSVNVQVTDQRLDKSKVSSKKNGYGMEMAPITAAEDVAVTVRKAIEKELQARGFQLGSDAALVRIAADLTRFYNDHKMGFFAGDAVADLNMSVIVKSNSGALLFSKQIIAQGMEKNTQLASGNNAKIALERALESGMKTLFDDQAFLSALLASSGSTAAVK